MKTADSKYFTTSSRFHQDWFFCIAAIWITVIYSVIIQYAFIEIPKGMLILGALVLATYAFVCFTKTCNMDLIFTDEGLWMIGFMVYLLPVGLLLSLDPSRHVNQWITSMEYLFMMIVIASIIKDSGTISFIRLLFVVAVAMSVIFLEHPVLHTEGRYSISKDVNPNGLGMTFTAGIWAVLFLQQRKNINILLPTGIMVLLTYSIIKTGSRKALIAAVIIIVLWYTFCYMPRVIKGKSKWKGVIILFSIVFAIFVGKEFIRMYSESDISARMEGLDNEMSGGLRSAMYKNGLQMFLSNPILGTGFMAYSISYGHYSHATIVEVPVSAGAIGSFIYFAAYYISIKKCIVLNSFFKGKKEYLAEAAETKMLLIMWTAMLFYCTCIIHPYQFDSFIMFGIIFGYSSYLQKKMEQFQPKKTGKQERQCKWIK